MFGRAPMALQGKEDAQQVHAMYMQSVILYISIYRL